LVWSPLLFLASWRLNGSAWAVPRLSNVPSAAGALRAGATAPPRRAHGGRRFQCRFILTLRSLNMFTTSGVLVDYNYSLLFALITIRIVFDFSAQLPIVAMKMLRTAGRYM
jgi:hypothetical protein